MREKIERVINQLQIESIPFSSFISKHARLNIRHHHHHNRYDQYSYKKEKERLYRIGIRNKNNK